jgi:BD-FAE protein
MTKVSRRFVLGAAGLVPAAGLLTACHAESSTSKNSLTFDKAKFTEKTATITTAAGKVEVGYRLYSRIPYVSKPVDADYQSLTIAVPVKIDGKEVDAADAPILFEIPVGGYMSAKAVDDPFSRGGGMPSAAMSGPPGARPSGSLSSGSLSGSMPSGSMPSGSMPSGALPSGAGSTGQNAAEALAAGWVVVQPGARGRDNKASDGKNFGTAPAAIVDLKAAVRYLRANKGAIPGNPDKIVSSGTSAGGALSALLGASGDSDLYAKHLSDLGAANASDAIFAVAAYCPITDLENADKAYEFLWGGLPGKGIDKAVTGQLAGAFASYQDGLKLNGLDGKRLTADRYQDYLLTTYLAPAATKYLTELSAADRAKYLATNRWLAWSGSKASFTFDAYLGHVGSRKKSQPAFDAFDLSAAENNEFGSATVNARHFTEYSAQRNKTGAVLDSDISDLRNLMNPMYFLGQTKQKRPEHWFLRTGTIDTDTSLTVLSNLAARVATAGQVDSRMYWDGGHGVNLDPGKFITWGRDVTGYTAD